MVALLLDDNKTNDGMFILANNDFAGASCYLYISLPSLHHYNMKLPNFMSPLY